MLAIIQSRILCLPSHIKNLKIAQNCNFIRNTDWGFLRTELRRIFGPKREEDGSCRKMYNDELHNLYSSPNIVKVIKSRGMR
jgi:hypothetical protein